MAIDTLPTVFSAPLLLPHFPDILIVQGKGELSIQRLPSWLATEIGLSEPQWQGQPVSTVLEPHLPGIGELVEGVLRSGHQVQGYETELLNARGERARILLEGSPNLSGGSGPGVVVSVQMAEGGTPTLPRGVPQAFCGMVGRSTAMQKLFNKVRLYSAVDAPVLITGETGAGKEGVAQALHRLGSRTSQPFVAVNCSAISENLFESELFGHEKGSFTGAIRHHKGRFERADGGTLFLDEIGDMPQGFQSKLLRVLEDEMIERVGGERPFKVNVRVIAATNRNLEDEARRKVFRADLYYRLGALQIHVPPLRERTDDLPDLVQHFIGTLNERYGRNIIRMTPEALNLLRQYWWPGNVRELRNLMERLFAENLTEVISLRALREWYEERLQAMRDGVAYDPRVTILPHQVPIPMGMNHHGNPTILSPDAESEAADLARPAQGVPPQVAIPRAPVELDEAAIRKAVVATRGNMTQAAKLLGVHKATLYRYLKALNLNRDSL